MENPYGKSSVVVVVVYMETFDFQLPQEVSKVIKKSNSPQ